MKREEQHDDDDADGNILSLAQVGTTLKGRELSLRVFVLSRVIRRTRMDKDRIKGAGHQVKGSVKEAAGKVTGDRKTEAEGKAEKVAGKVQNTAGGLKDSLRGK